MKNKLLSKIIGLRRPYKLGLVLSGGGARGYAHLGVLKAMEERNLKPGIISGVSAGAIVGAFYCSGYSPDDIFDLMHDKGIFRYSKFQIPRKGLLSLPGLHKIIEANLEAGDLEALAIPLVIAASNFNKGKIEYFRKGNLSDLVLASSSIPILFSPVEIGKYQYVDGGLYDNLPVTPLLGQCQRIIGVNANPIDEEYEFKNLIQVAVRTFHLSVSATVQRSKDKVDLLIEPEALAEYEILDSGKAREMFDIGYEFGQRALKGF